MGMSTTRSSRLHGTLPIEPSTQTRPLKSQIRMNRLPRVLCLLGLNVSLYLAHSDMCQLAGCHHCCGLLEWSVSFRPFCLHPAFCSNSPLAILDLPNFLQCLLDLSNSFQGSRFTFLQETCFLLTHCLNWSLLECSSFSLPLGSP